jgi:DNA polymerase III subunit delta
MTRPAAFLDHLEQGAFAPVYLFVGDAELLIEEAWYRLREKVVPAKALRFNGESLSARDVGAAEVVERLATLPMFGPKRLLRVTHVEAWKKDQEALLAAYLARPKAVSCAVLCAPSRKGLSALEAAVRATGMVVEFAAPSESELPGWLQGRARQRQKRLNLRAADQLLERVGNDMGRLASELDKLCLFVGERKEIDASDVEEVVSRQRQFSVFELLRAVGKSDGARAVTMLRRLLLHGEPPLPVLALLARQIRILWQTMDAAKAGSSDQQIGQRLKLPASVVGNYRQTAALFSEQSLYHAHRIIRECDLALKSSGVAPEMLLESLILALCRLHKKGPEA